MDGEFCRSRALLFLKVRSPSAQAALERAHSLEKIPILKCEVRLDRKANQKRNKNAPRTETKKNRRGTQKKNISEKQKEFTPGGATSLSYRMSHLGFVAVAPAGFSTRDSGQALVFPPSRNAALT